MLLMGKSTISIAIFNSYVLRKPEGMSPKMDFPIENGGSFHSYVTNYQRVRSCSIAATCFGSQDQRQRDHDALGAHREAGAGLSDHAHLAPLRSSVFYNDKATTEDGNF